MIDDELFDITIIGGGPVGLFGLYYAGLRGARAKVVDSLPELGGQLSALYPDKYIFDVPGFPKVIAKDLVAMLKEQAMQFEPSVCLDERVEHIKFDDQSLFLTTPKGLHKSKTVIIAGGVGAFLPRRLDIRELDELEDRGVYYFVKDKTAFKDLDILVIGGGDTAVDWACELGEIARKVTLVHKFPVWQAHESSVRRMMMGPAKVKMLWELKEVHGEEHVEGATIWNNKTGEAETLNVQAILVNIGFITNLGPILNWGLEIEGNGIKVNPQMETNLPGVYAAGDIANYPGKIKLIATGAGEAAMAANNAKHRIDPMARVFPGHSTDRKDLERAHTADEKGAAEAASGSK